MVVVRWQIYKERIQKLYFEMLDFFWGGEDGCWFWNALETLISKVENLIQYKM